MNVTLKLSDTLCREARHRAVDRGLSLSAWMAELLERELSRSGQPAEDSLLDAVSMTEFTDRGFAPEREVSPAREVSL